MNVKGENLGNEKGGRGIPLFIGSEVWHLKQRDQPDNDTCHIPRKGKMKLLITNKVRTCGMTSNN